MKGSSSARILWRAAFATIVAAGLQSPATAARAPDRASASSLVVASDDVIALGGVGARAAALLLSGQSGGAIDGSLVWTSNGLDPTTGKVEIFLSLEVDGQSLLGASLSPRVPIEVYGYLVDTAGTIVAHIADGLLLHSGSLRSAIEAGGLDLVGRMSVPPGLYSLRMLVRNRETREFFLTSRDLDLRFAGRTEPLLLPPLAAGTHPSWVVAGADGIDPEAQRVALSTRSPWPAARPAWRTDLPLDLVLSGSELTDNLELSSQLIDVLGRRVLEPTVTIAGLISDRHQLSSYRAVLGAPDVPAGAYRLVVELTDSDTGSSVSQSMMVLIHDLGRDLVWTDPEAPRNTAAAPLPATGDEGVIDIESATIRNAYLEALRLWAGGDTIGARRELAALEHPLESSSSTRAWRQLINVQRVTAIMLAKDDPRSLAGVAMLHRDMYSWYRARTEPQLARHSWQMAAMAARLAPRVWEDPLASEFGECLLIDLAGKLTRSGQPRSAHELLDAALEVAPDSAPALLGLGALLERTGAPDGAIEVFDRLYQQHPNRVDGKIRLAITHARLGQDKPAIGLLEELTEDSNPQWIRAIAYQELTQILAARGTVDEAQDVLAEGIAALPENQRLQIQRAHLLDLAGRPGEAAEVAEQIRSLGSRQGTSPRYRYTEWPDLDGQRVRTILEEALAQGLAGLQESTS